MPWFGLNARRWVLLPGALTMREDQPAWSMDCWVARPAQMVERPEAGMPGTVCTGVLGVEEVRERPMGRETKSTWEMLAKSWVGFPEVGGWWVVSAVEGIAGTR